MASRLSPEQIKDLRQRLQQQFRGVRESVIEELRRCKNEQYIQLAEQVHDSGEQAVADLLSDINLAVIDRHINQLRTINAALSQISEGNYGTCVDCEGDIRYERLKVEPTAKRCHECQVRFEAAAGRPQPPTL
jgi:DnaK suppressor protein